MIPFLDLKAQYHSIAAELEPAVLEVLRSGGYVQGRRVAEFERNFAAFCGAKHAVAVNTGTSALHLALLAMGIGPRRRGHHRSDDIRRDGRRDSLRQCDTHFR